MDIIESLIKKLLDVRYEAIPKETIELTRMSILDTFGVLQAGKGAPGCNELIDLVKYWGGRAESTILLDGRKIPAPNAALANAVMCRALDFDTATAGKGCHLDASVIPVALAICEKGEISGEEFLAAIVLAKDLASRINVATKQYYGFDPTICCGIFATTAVAARLLGLDFRQTHHALGMALNEASGTFQSNIDGALSVRLNQGMAALKGIICAELALRGYTGVTNVIQGVCGYANLIARGNFDCDILLEDLEGKYYGDLTLFKRWPSCGGTLAATDLAVEVARSRELDVKDISDVVVFLSKGVAALVGSDFKVGETPAVDAQFSVQYAVANALLRKDSLLVHFTEAYVKDEAVMELIRKINVKIDEKAGSGARLEIRRIDGNMIVKDAKIMRGHHSNPLSPEEILGKYVENIAFAQRVEQGKAIQEQVMDLEKLNDIRSLVNLLES